MTRQSGSILILVLFVLVVLSLSALSFAYHAGLKHRSVQHEVVRIRLETEARSAVAQALAQLAANTNSFDHRAEPWHSHAPFESVSLFGAGDDDAPEHDSIQTRYHVTDEEASGSGEI
ncbi:MAG: hypothetical protein ACODAQ_02015 [Phycisphaeraceae bacterium]